MHSLLMSRWSYGGLRQRCTNRPQFTGAEVPVTHQIMKWLLCIWLMRAVGGEALVSHNKWFG